MSAFDTLVAYKFIKLLVTPFDETDAYERGIIDADGNILKSRSDLKSSKDKKAYPSNVYTLVWNLKRILSKVPAMRNKLASFTAAMYLLKEEHGYNDEQIRIITQESGFDHGSVLMEITDINREQVSILKEETMTRRSNDIKLISHEIQTPLDLLEARYGGSSLSWNDLPEDEKFDIAELVFPESKAEVISRLEWDEIDRTTKKKLQKAIRKNTDDMITLEEENPRQIAELLSSRSKKFTARELDQLRKKYREVTAIDPTSREFLQIVDMLDQLPSEALKQLIKADIPYLSSLAKTMSNKAAMRRSRSLAASTDYRSGKVLYGERVDPELGYDPDEVESGPYNMVFYMSDDRSAKRLAKDIHRKFGKYRTRGVIVYTDGNSVYVDFDSAEFEEDPLNDDLYDLKAKIYKHAKKAGAFTYNESVQPEEKTPIVEKNTLESLASFPLSEKMGFGKKTKSRRGSSADDSGGLDFYADDRVTPSVFEFKNEGDASDFIKDSQEYYRATDFTMVQSRRQVIVTYDVDVTEAEKKKLLSKLKVMAKGMRHSLTESSNRGEKKSLVVSFSTDLKKEEEAQIERMLNRKFKGAFVAKGGTKRSGKVGKGSIDFNFLATEKEIEAIKDAMTDKYGSKVTFSEKVEEAASDDRTNVAKELKKWAKKYVTGKISVKSGKGKTPFVQLTAVGGKISNELRKMVIDKIMPDAKVGNMDDISYGNVTDRYIAIKAESWKKVMGIDEEIGTTTAGVAGTGDDPVVAVPVRKKKKRRGINMNEAQINEWWEDQANPRSRGWKNAVVKMNFKTYNAVGQTRKFKKGDDLFYHPVNIEGQVKTYKLVVAAEDPKKAGTYFAVHPDRLGLKGFDSATGFLENE